MNEIGRDIPHACLAVGLATDLAHQGKPQGDDFFPNMDHRLAAGIEYVAAFILSYIPIVGIYHIWSILQRRHKWLIENLPWKNKIYGNNGFYYTDYRAWVMTCPVLEKNIRLYYGVVIGHYEEIKGVEMPFSKMANNDMGIERGASDLLVVIMNIQAILYY